MTHCCFDCGKSLKLEKALECQFCGKLDEIAYCFRCYSKHFFPVHLSKQCKGTALNLVEKETDSEKALCPLCKGPFDDSKDLFLMGARGIRICYGCGVRPNRIPRTGPCSFCDKKVATESNEPFLSVFQSGFVRRACKMCHQKGPCSEDWKFEQCYYCDKIISSTELARKPYYVYMNGLPRTACKECHSNGKHVHDWL